MKNKTLKSNTEKEVLILDGISQLLDNGHNMPRNFRKLPLTPLEQSYIIQVCFAELEDPKMPIELVYLYGQILDYVKNKIIYN